MKKLILLVIMAVLMLTGCTPDEEPYTAVSLMSTVNDAVVAEIPEAVYNNAVKEYYSYYLPRGVGREERDATSNLFNIYGNKAILNIDIASIIAQEYYEGEDEYGKRLRNLDTFSQTEFVETLFVKIGVDFVVFVVEINVSLVRVKHRQTGTTLKL